MNKHTYAKRQVVARCVRALTNCLLSSLHVHVIIHYAKHKHKQLGGWELPGQDGEEGESSLARMGAPWPGWGGGWELPGQDGEEGGSSLARMGRRVGAPWPGWLWQWTIFNQP